MPAKEPAVPTDATLGYTFQNDFLALSRAFSCLILITTIFPGASS
jgi:hypothetical protein